MSAVLIHLDIEALKFLLDRASHLAADAALKTG
jgi:hypothetical protein